MEVNNKKIGKRAESLGSKVNFDKGLLLKSIIEFDSTNENNEGMAQNHLISLSTGETTLLTESRKNEMLKEIEWTPIYSEVDKFTKLNGISS